MSEEDKKYVEALRLTVPAVNKDAVDKFRIAAATRHNELDQLLANEAQSSKLPFLEREMIRIQRDALRAVLTSANIQAEIIAQMAPAPAEAPKEPPAPEAPKA